MNIKGFDELRGHVSDLNTVSGRARIASMGLIVFTLTTFYFIISDQIPTWTIDSEIVVMAIGLLVFSLFFSRRKEYTEKYKEQSYRNAFIQFALPGLAVIFAAIAHIAYMNGPPSPARKITMGMTIIGWYLLIFGVGFWIRSVMNLGVDKLKMLYV